jgi:hypothetical protein
LHIINQSLLTLKLRGESRDKGYPKDANGEASKGVLYPLGAFFVLSVSFFRNNLE